MSEIYVDEELGPHVKGKRRPPCRAGKWRGARDWAALDTNPCGIITGAGSKSQLPIRHTREESYHTVFLKDSILPPF